jgi:hypothetical protein
MATTHLHEYEKYTLCIPFQRSFSAGGTSSNAIITYSAIATPKIPTAATKLIPTPPVT